MSVCSPTQTHELVFEAEEGAGYIVVAHTSYDNCVWMLRELWKNGDDLTHYDVRDCATGRLVSWVVN